MEIKIKKTTEETINLKPGDCFKREGVGYTKILSETEFVIVWSDGDITLYNSPLGGKDVFQPISQAEFELATKDAVAEYEKNFLKKLSLIKQKDF